MTLPDGKLVKLQLWDTAGQERFRTITKTYYRGAQGILVVYDITDRTSFQHCSDWLNEIVQHGLEDVELALIGNKCDLESQRAVPYSDAQELADDHQMLFLETSALNNTNVTGAFMKLTERVRDRLLTECPNVVERPESMHQDNFVIFPTELPVHKETNSTKSCCAK